VDDLEKKQVRRGEYPWGDSRFKFRNFVHVGDDEAIHQKGIDYVIFHKKILEEMPKIFELTAEDPSRWITKFRTKYGESCFEDDFIVVFCMQK